MEILHKRVAGIDVHRMKHVVTTLIEDAAGQIGKQTREFGGFKRDLKALAEWLRGLGVELVILESTGIYWKSVHAHLENAPKFDTFPPIIGEIEGASPDGTVT
jgi:transposase